MNKLKDNAEQRQEKSPLMECVYCGATCLDNDELKHKINCITLCEDCAQEYEEWKEAYSEK